MAFIVVYDANVLYPNTLRDLLIRIAQQPHLVQAKWSNQIIDETLRALQKNRPDITKEKAARLRELINESVRDCLVTGYQPLIEALDLPDPDDRHVLAADMNRSGSALMASCASCQSKRKAMVCSASTTAGRRPGRTIVCSVYALMERSTSRGFIRSFNTTRRRYGRTFSSMSRRCSGSSFACPHIASRGSLSCCGSVTGNV